VANTMTIIQEKVKMNTSEETESTLETSVETETTLETSETETTLETSVIQIPGVVMEDTVSHTSQNR
jgi:hypothetical protein